ncbi:transcriptional regulator [Acetobacter orientalis]|uniref:transcriptional regulator n=2 Tax=Acetobacter orientalis TaxID=146474 RepID=UPI0034E227B7
MLAVNMFVWQTYVMEPKELISRVGGPTILARELGLRHSTPLLWKSIPPHHCPAIEEAFSIPREELRPDLFKRTPARERA